MKRGNGSYCGVRGKTQERILKTVVDETSLKQRGLQRDRRKEIIKCHESHMNHKRGTILNMNE